MLGALSLLGGAFGALSSRSAAKSQQKAADKQLALQERVYDEQVGRLAPYAASGVKANSAVNFLLGLGEAPMIGGTPLDIETIKGTPGTSGVPVNNSPFAIREDLRRRVQPTAATPDSYRVGGKSFNSLVDAQAYARENATGGKAYSFEGSPGLQFQMDQARRAVDGSAAARGSLFSGATIKSQQKNLLGLAQQDWYNNLNAMMAQSGAGQSAAAGQGAAGQAFAAGGSNALANYGNAASAGTIGAAKAINSGIQDWISIQAYQKNAGKNALAL